MLRNSDFGPISEKYREFAADINQSGSRLLALISDILDVSKVEAVEIEIDEEKLDLYNSFMNRSKCYKIEWNEKVLILQSCCSRARRILGQSIALETDPSQTLEQCG